MTTEPRVILTRPADQSLVWVEGLKAQGLHAQSFPLLEIAAALQPLERIALHARVFATREFAVCIWVSTNAVTHFFQSNQPIVPVFRTQTAHQLIANESHRSAAHLRHWATGPGTVQALLEQGVPLAQIDAPDMHSAQWDSEALWAQVAHRLHAGCKVLILRGEDIGIPSASRDWLAQQLRAAGAQVEFAAVYQRRAPSFSAAQTAWAQQAAQDGSVWVFSSSQAIAHLPQLKPAQGAGPWSRARCVATHERIAQA
ncbi:MAG: uroporphyrinogen-III synthase, partial [Burkholderiaceae bacterium]